MTEAVRPSLKIEFQINFLFRAALANNHMVEDRRNNLCRDGILKGKLLPKRLFNCGQVNTRS